MTATPYRNAGIASADPRTVMHRWIFALACVGFLTAVLDQAGFAAGVRPRSVGLGAILTTSDGGQIFGFDINQNGNDGVLASAQSTDDGEIVSVETFDQDTGTITRSFAQHSGSKHEYGVNGIFAGDVALLTHFVTPKGSIFPKRRFVVMNPVTAQRFTGAWTPPLPDIDIQQGAPDQTTATSALFAIELKKESRPVLLVSDVAANTFSNIIHLDPSLFGLGNGPHLAQYTAANKAVFALSPDAGTVRGDAPLNILVDLDTGKVQQFEGFNNGYFHSGYVNGLAVDPNTGIAATTTELNSQVEFYNLKKKTGIVAVQLPCTTDTDQFHSGSNIAVDPVNKLFLVTETNYCDGSQGSAIVVYDERGRFIEVITGFHFAIGEPAPVINPAKRMGWAFGPAFDQLQQFFY